jgi:hypothetical protein
MIALDDRAMHIGQPKFPAGVTISEVLVVEAEQMRDRSEEVAHMGLPFDGLKTQIVGGPANMTAFEPSSSSGTT